MGTWTAIIIWMALTPLGEPTIGSTVRLDGFASDYSCKLGAREVALQMALRANNGGGIWDTAFICVEKRPTP